MNTLPIEARSTLKWIRDIFCTDIPPKIKCASQYRVQCCQVPRRISNLKNRNKHFDEVIHWAMSLCGTATLKYPEREVEERVCGGRQREKKRWRIRKQRTIVWVWALQWRYLAKWTELKNTIVSEIRQT